MIKDSLLVQGKDTRARTGNPQKIKLEPKSNTHTNKSGLPYLASQRYCWFLLRFIDIRLETLHWNW